MNAHDRTTLRRMREHWEQMNPEARLIGHLSYREMILAVKAAEEEVATCERYLAKLNLLEAAVEKMVPEEKLDEVAESFQAALVNYTEEAANRVKALEQDRDKLQRMLNGLLKVAGDDYDKLTMHERAAKLEGKEPQ